MRADTPCSPWSGLPAKMTSMHPTFCRARTRSRNPQAQPFRNGMAAARKSKRLASSRPTANHRQNPGRPWRRLCLVRCGSFFLAQVEALKSPDAAVVWASKSLNAKNSLSAPDARLVEDAFRAKIARLEKDDGAP